MMALGDVAAKIGLPCFPCDAEKRPLDKGGFHTATADAAAIQAAFDRPRATTIGVPTGLPSGLIVVDVDIKGDRPGMDWLNANKEALPETRTHRTRSGGLHLLFQRPAGCEIRCSVDRVASGIDIRGEGGYVVFPPSPGYVIADDSEPAEMPKWLIAACMRQERRETAPDPAPPRTGGSTRYGLAALEAECAAIRRAPFGQQEVTLNAAALKIGGLCAGGELVESVARAELIAAGMSMPSESSRPHWSRAEIETKVLRAMSDGSASPRSPEPNGRPSASAARPAALAPEQPGANESAAEPADPPIKVIYFDDIKPVLETADFVEGLLIDGLMSVTYGQSNSGKTFWMMDLAMHVAAGRKWANRDVEQGAVLWLAMEGAYGVSNRVTAWREHYGIDAASMPFAVIPVALNLLDPTADTLPLIATVGAVARKLAMPVRLIVVDTLSRAIAGGNENSPEDMGAIVANGTRLQQETGAHVNWIHHSGKDEAKGARGHSLLRAATDTEIEISAEGAQRVARVTKQRELDCAGEFAFELKVVELGTNRRGKPLTSCAVVHSQGSAGAALPVTRLRGHVRRAFEVLTDCIATSGKCGFTDVPGRALSVPETWWRDRFYETAMPGAEQGAKQRAFHRAAEHLLQNRIVGMAAHRVWIVERGFGTQNDPDRYPDN